MHRVRHLIRTHDLDEVSVVYVQRRRSGERPIVSDARSAERVLRPCFAHHIETYEAARLLLLDSAHRLKACVTLSTGGFDTTVFDPRIIFAVACRTLSAALILAHNHPSGECLPSVADLAHTRELVLIGSALRIPLLDHLILLSLIHI